MLIITGTQRSGTSVLARYCHNVGYLLGGRWNHEVNGGMEEPNVVQVNESIISGENLEHSADYIRNCGHLVIKDPRFIRPGVLRFWVDRRDDLRLIINLRCLTSVQNSLAQHPDWFMDPPTISDHESMLSKLFLDLSRLQVPHRLLPFPEFLERYDLVHGILTEFGQLAIEPVLGRRIWNALIKPDMVHFGKEQGSE